MTDFVGKKYKLESNENFDEYMMALGVNEKIRQLGLATSISMQLLENNGTFTLRVTSSVRDRDILFRSGEPFDEVTEDGRPVKSVITLEKDKMVLKQKDKDGREALIVRTFTATDVTAVMTYGSVSCTRRFKLEA